MVVKPEIGFSYKCPFCGDTKLHTFDVFRLSTGDRLCVCDCLRFCIHLTFSDGEVSVDLLCPYCGHIHTYRLPVSELVKNHVNELICCETQQVCAYAGAPHRIHEKIEQAGDPQEAENECILLQTDSGALKTANLVLSGLYTVEEMLYARKILCPCGSKKFELAFFGGYIQVKCGVCGAYTRLLAKNDEDIQRIWASHEIQLTK